MKIKNIVKQCFSLLLALMLMMSMTVTAFAAESSVTFESGKVIAFEPGSVYTETDLFDNFKGVMPGDTLSEEVTIQNKSNDCDYIKVYMRAVLHDENGNPISDKVLAELRSDERRGAASELEYMHDFLSQLSMTVKSGGKVIYDASPDELDGLSDNVYLGTLRKGESAKLDVQLTVPIEMGNEYADRIGEVDWVFVVEGFDDPVDPPDDDTMLTVRKVWVDDEIGRPDSVTVQLLRDGKVRDEVELSQSNNWVYTWDRLDDDYNWSVLEAEVPDGYEATYTTKGNTTTITNTEENEPTDPTDPTEPTDPTDPTEPVDPVDLKVIKKWDVDGKDHPDSVKVTLYNGDHAVESVWLGDWNNWSYSWRNLDGNGNWQIIETSIPKGWVPSYSYWNGVVTITNSESLIQTGQLSWPIPVMGALGLVLIAYGIYVIAKKRKNERA